MHKETIKSIEEALKHHINYNNPNRVNGKYLRTMDSLAYRYSGAPAEKISSLLEDYFAAVNVKNLDEAIIRLKNKDITCQVK